jgi:hypothetical protein
MKNRLILIATTLLLLTALQGRTGFKSLSAPKPAHKTDFRIASELGSPSSDSSIFRNSTVFHETFESNSPSLSGWSQIYVTGNKNWSYDAGSSGGSVRTAYNGSSNARFTRSNGGPHITKLVSPVMDINGLQNGALSFWYAQEISNQGQNQLKVYYRTDSSSNWVQLAHYTASVSAWTQASLSLPSLSSTFQIAFEGIDNFGHANVIDEVVITASAPPITTFPFLETFEAASASRADWSQVIESGTSNWTFATGAGSGTINSAYRGTLNARFTGSTYDGFTTKLISPVLNISALPNPTLSFWYAQEFWSPDQNELKVYYRTSSGSAWTQIAHYTDNVSAWTNAILTLPNPSATYQIAFEGIDKYGYPNVLDDVLVSNVSTNPELLLSTQSLSFPFSEVNEETYLNFDIRNSGSGTLVLNAAPGISGTDPAQFLLIDLNGYPLSLPAGQSASYSVRYNPTAIGNHRATVSFTYEGVHTVALFGKARNLLFADDFETYTDFGLDLSPWTQYDGDNSTTYAITDVSFANQNYTGSFIAFNPASTSPALAGAWEPHSGAKYAAAFAATTAPNNDWLISPAIAFGADPAFTFWAKSVSAVYGLERIKVLYSTTGNNYTDFNNYLEGSAATFAEVPNAWTQYSYDLPPECANTTVYIAIQCVSNDAFVLMIDKFRAFGVVDPMLSVSPESHTFAPFFPSYRRYQEFTITNSGNGMLTIPQGGIQITGDDEFVVEFLPDFPLLLGAGQSATFMVKFHPTSPGNYSATLNISDSVSNTTSISLSATTNDDLLNEFPHVEGFEGEVFGWVIRDADRDGYNWEILNNSSEVHFSYTGNNCIISRSWVSDAKHHSDNAEVALASSEVAGQSSATKQSRNRGALSPDNWLISPRILLSENMKLSWRVAAQDPAWPSETYSVLISTTTPDTDAFTPLLTETMIDGDWHKRELSLSAYANSTVYIAFRHHDTTNQFYLKLDTIKLNHANDDSQYGIVADGTVDIELDSINDTVQGRTLNTRYRGSGLIDTETVIAHVCYAHPGLDLPNSGLHMGLSGVSFAGTSMEILHNLGFIPQQAFWRIQPGAWNLLSSISPDVSAWTDSTIAFSIPAGSKNGGDFDIVFPRSKDDTLPVTLTGFVASLIHNGRVKLSWTTATETGVLGFTVLRNELEDLAGAIAVSPLIEATNSSTEQIYEFHDAEIQAQTRYYYWLLSRDFDGAETFFGPLSIHTIGGVNQGDMVPGITRNLGNFPNPFNPSTTLRYSLAEAGKVNLKIYNARGQMVRDFSATHNAPGVYRRIFDGKDDSGNELTSGVYFYRFETKNHSSTHRMMLLK